VTALNEGQHLAKPIYQVPTGYKFLPTAVKVHLLGNVTNCNAEDEIYIQIYNSYESQGSLISYEKNIRTNLTNNTTLSLDPVITTTNLTENVKILYDIYVYGDANMPPIVIQIDGILTKI
jgi:hypothetical protein